MIIVLSDIGVHGFLGGDRTTGANPTAANNKKKANHPHL
jgi:hypothetical protein